MDSLWHDYRGETYHVLGLEIADPELIFRTRRVIQCCVGLLVVLVARTVGLLLIGESATTAVLSVLFSLSIPAFGYLGARDGSSTLMCIFVALMTLNAANAVAILGMVAYAVSAGVPQRAPDGSTRPFQMTTSVWVQVVLISAWAGMALIASYQVNKLFNKLAQGDAIAAAHQTDTEVGLPQIDTNLDEAGVEPGSFGLPSGGALHERDVDDEITSPIRRKKAGREMKQLSPQE